MYIVSFSSLFSLESRCLPEFKANLVKSMNESIKEEKMKIDKKQSINQRKQERVSTIKSNGSLEVPDFDFHIISSGGNDSILAIKPDCGDEVFMGVLNFLFLFSEVQVPDPDGFIVRGRVQILAIGVDGETAYPVVVASESC
jgi:hypothetical protein